MLKFSEENSEKNFGPLKPGESVKVQLQPVVIDDKGNMVITFKGVDVDNAGTFQHKFWANVFDESDAMYKEETAQATMKQIQQLAEAFIPKETLLKLDTGNSCASLFKVTSQALNQANRNIATSIKVIYKKGSDVHLTLPFKFAFISTTLTPRGLKLGAGLIAGTNIPYERVLPLSHYGVSASVDANGEQSAPGEDLFGLPVPTAEFKFPV